MTTRVSVNISLTPELGRFVETRVASGRYSSVSEVVRDGLRLLELNELARETVLKNLREQITVGLDQIDRGQVHDGDKVFKEIKSRSRKRRGGAK